MNWAAAERIANAALYEGYLLYPYRPSALKNRRQWMFGVLYPPALCLHESGPQGRPGHREPAIQVPAREDQGQQENEAERPSKPVRNGEERQRCPGRQCQEREHAGEEQAPTLGHVRACPARPEWPRSPPRHGRARH